MKNVSVLHCHYITLPPPMRYFINSLKLLSENPQPPLHRWNKSTSLFTHSPTKNSESASPPFLPTLKIFQTPPPEKMGEVEDTVFFSKNGFIHPNFTYTCKTQNKYQLLTWIILKLTQFV